MKVKLVGFDWDGTLVDIDTASWRIIDRKLGVEQEDEKLNALFFEGKIAYNEWSRRTVEFYKTNGLNYSRFLDIVKTMPLMAGALETFNELKRRGIKTAIVSGSIANIYDYFAQQYGLKADYVSFVSRIHFDEHGNIVGGEFNDYDYEGKAKAFENFAKREGLSLSDCAFVGDSENDIPLFKLTYGIAIMPKQKHVETYAKAVVKEKNLTQVLKFLD